MAERMDPAEADRIAAAIDWNPTCLPGQERQKIVQQIGELAMERVNAHPTCACRPAGAGDEFEEHLLDANKRMGAALVEIGMALGLPAPTARQPWGAPEILARIREDPLADAADVKPERPSVQSGSPNASQVDPVDLDTLTGWVEAALESSDIEVEVREASGAVSSLQRLVRSLRSAGLLDEGDSVPVCALRALAQGEPPGEVSDDYGVPAAVVRAALPLVGAAVPSEQED